MSHQTELHGPPYNLCSFLTRILVARPLAVLPFYIAQYPEFYSFPPFFTLQPTTSSRQKQLALWRDLLLTYHTHHKLKTLIVHECPLWSNVDIDRRLDASGVSAVMEDFVRSGHGEWTDETRTKCRVLWRTPSQLASDIYEWAAKNGFVGSVCTIYELHSGEDVDGMSFEGADEELLRRAVSVLEERGQAAVFKGETSAEDGVKFF